MAYRVKGFLTLKQRNTLSQFIQAYSELIYNLGIESCTRELAEGVFLPWVALARYTLYIDECKILEKAIGSVETVRRT